MIYDAVLITSFGGPERREDVVSVFENVLHGENGPRARMPVVEEQYDHFAGRSPIDQNCELIAALESELGGRHPPFRSTGRHPLLADTRRRMRADGVRRAFASPASEVRFRQDRAYWSIGRR